MTERLPRTLGGLVAVLCLTFPRVVSAQEKPARPPEPPRELRAVIGYAPLVLPDGTIGHYYTQGQHGAQELMWSPCPN